MRNILAEDNVKVLHQFAFSNVLLAFDFDGTLAPIVYRPEAAAMSEATTLLLRELSQLYPCVVISGRSQRDALKRLRGAGVHETIGNHGAEMNGYTGTAVLDWKAMLDRRLGGLKGVVIEDKIFSIAVHYRHSREKKKAKAAILVAANELKNARLIGGKNIVNITPIDAPHKGMALERARVRLGCDTAIYVGDDETDEDVFMLDQPGQLLTIRVGRKKSSAASYFIPRQNDIEALLGALVSIRQDAGIASPPWGRQ